MSDLEQRLRAAVSGLRDEAGAWPEVTAASMRKLADLVEEGANGIADAIRDRDQAIEHARQANELASKIRAEEGAKYMRLVAHDQERAAWAAQMEARAEKAEETIASYSMHVMVPIEKHDAMERSVHYAEQLKRLIVDSGKPHGSCQPRSERACTACNALEEMDAIRVSAALSIQSPKGDISVEPRGDMKSAICESPLGVRNSAVVLVCRDRDAQCPTPDECATGCTYKGEPV